MLSKKEFTIFSWWFLLGDTGLLLPSGSDWNLHFWLSCNQAFKLQIFGLLSLHNFMSQLLISSLSVSVVYLSISQSILCSCSVTKSYLTLCDPMDCSLSVFSVHGILQARILKWVSFPSPGDLPDPGTEPYLRHWQADSLPLGHQGNPSVICLSICVSSYWFQVSGELLYSWGIQ